jgi:molybdenum cofactor cytidylyltransferase
MVTPVILAAGSSTRLGQPKALLDFDGTPGLSLMIEACHEAGCSPPVVVVGADTEVIAGAVGQQSVKTRRRSGIDLRGGRLVVHRAWAAGRSSSLKAGLRARGGSGEDFLIFPVDCPLVRADTITTLREARASSPPGIRIVVPVHGQRRGHPVLCDAALQAEFLGLADDEPAHLIVRRDPARVLEVVTGDPAVVDNLDTPDDYARARARWHTERA